MSEINNICRECGSKDTNPEYSFDLSPVSVLGSCNSCNYKEVQLLTEGQYNMYLLSIKKG